MPSAVTVVDDRDRSINKPAEQVMCYACSDKQKDFHGSETL